MPLTKSAKKALRQAKRRQRQNSVKLNTASKIRREILKLVSTGKTKEAQAKLPLLYKALDKAAKTGVFKKNAAARKKSKITKLISKTLKR